MISKKPDVTIYEAMNFLDKFKQVLTDEESGGRHSEVNDI